MNVDMAMLYLQFVEGRYDVARARAAGLPREEWTDDPILARAKFTNVYRAVDRGSQFLLAELLVPAESFEDVLGRAWLYRFTNQPNAWLHYRSIHGAYPTADDIRSGRVYRAWDEFHRSGGAVFGSAYRIFAHPGRDKSISQLEWIIGVASDMLTAPGFVDEFEHEDAPCEKVKMISRFPRCGPFMGMQILTDVGYSGWLPWYDEDEWVVPGPGARKGAEEIGMEPEEAIAWSWQLHRYSSHVRLAGRAPSRMDIQNTFCEFSKYARYTRDSRPRGFQPTRNGLPMDRLLLPSQRGSTPTWITATDAYKV